MQSGEMTSTKVSFCAAYIKWISTASRHLQTDGKKPIQHKSDLTEEVSGMLKEYRVQAHTTY